MLFAAYAHWLKGRGRGGVFLTAAIYDTSVIGTIGSMDIRKHKKIAISLHAINLALLLLLGFALFIVSQAFVVCTGTTQGADFSCTGALFIFFALPLVFGAIPLICLATSNRFTKALLYVYSGLLALIFFPVGTAIGVHTIYYLNHLGPEDEAGARR